MNRTGLLFLAVVSVYGSFGCFNALAQANFSEWNAASPWEIIQIQDFVASTDVSAQEGGVSVARTGLKFKRIYKHSSGLPLEFSASLDHYMIHDGTNVDLPPSLQSKGLMIGTKFPMPFMEGRTFFLGFDSGAYWQTAQDHAFHSGAFRSRHKVYAAFRKDQTILAAGTIVRPGYDEAVVPFVGVQYVFNERWSLHILSDEPSLDYRVNDRLTLRCLMSGYHDEFELTQGSRKGDVVKIQEWHVGLGADYAVSRTSRIQMAAGWAFGRTYEYLENGGKLVADDGVFFGVKVQAEF